MLRFRYDGSMTLRADGRSAAQLRDITITRGWSTQAEGSALIEFGNTRVLCTASFTQGVPRWLKGEGTGWVTAEYAMLPVLRILVTPAKQLRARFRVAPTRSPG